MTQKYFTVVYIKEICVWCLEVHGAVFRTYLTEVTRMISLMFILVKHVCSNFCSSVFIAFLIIWNPPRGGTVIVLFLFNSGSGFLLKCKVHLRFLFVLFFLFMCIWITTWNLLSPCVCLEWQTWREFFALHLSLSQCEQFLPRCVCLFLWNSNQSQHSNVYSKFTCIDYYQQ